MQKEVTSRSFHSPGQTLRWGVGALLALSLGACSSIKAPVPKDPEELADFKANNDPYEPLNRKMYDFTTAVDKYTFRPVAKAYTWAVPHFVRNALGNMATTMGEPVSFFSAVGAGKPRMAGDAFARWCINMVAGIGGLIDVAQYAGYKHQDIDAGLTLASWGVPSGPYLFLPMMGPASYRTAVGYGLNVGFSPFNYVPRGYGLLTFNWAYNAVGLIDTRANYLNALDAVQKDSLDPYATIRSAYQQQQKAKVDAIRNDHRTTVPNWYD